MFSQPLDFDAKKAGIVRRYAAMRLSPSTKEYAEDAVRQLARDHQPFEDLEQLVTAETRRMRGANEG